MTFTAQFISSLGLSLAELLDMVVGQANRLMEIIGQRDALQVELAHKNQQLAQLEEKLKQTEQRAFRSAAPFRIPDSRRNKSPRKPGRAKGHPGSCRPKPTRIDQSFHVPLPDCPQCHGPVTDLREVKQYIEEIPAVQPQNIELTTQEGFCACCDQSVRSTHWLQVSLAEGAAGVQLGPNALATAIELNKVKGLSLRKTCATLKDLFGLKLTPGGLSLAMSRVAAKLKGSYEELVQRLRTASTVHADETSWWVGGPGDWLWVFTNPNTTVYVIDPGRDRGVVHRVLGADYPGVLVSDCLAPYDDATPNQQKCYYHHFNAIKEAMEEHPEKGAGYLLDVRALLRTAMLFKALDTDPSTPQHQQCVQRLEERATQLLAQPRSQPQEERVRRRLFKQQDHLFTFLKHREVEATNNPAERQLRPAVISRKISCGNKTDKGARTWEILTSLAATATQLKESFCEIIRRAVRLQPSLGP